MQGEEEEALASDQFAPKLGQPFSREDTSRMLRFTLYTKLVFDNHYFIPSQVHRHRTMADEKCTAEREKGEEGGGGGGELHLDNPGEKNKTDDKYIMI